jgi:hypothetical protein
MRIYLLVLTATLVFTACQAHNKSGEYETASVTTEEATMARADMKMAAPVEASGPIDNTAAVITKAPTKIIRNASVEFQVNNTTESHERIKALLTKYNAYFGSDNNSTSAYRKDNNMTIRVPSKNFDALMDEVMKESIYTDYRNISAEDVTDQFVDAEARLKTKKQVEQRYLALLKDAKKVQDILDIEDKLRVIREEIEATEGKLKLLNDQVDYSTINLNIYQKLDYVPQPQTGFFSNLKEAFINGWRSLIGFVIVIVRLWPFIIIVGLAVALIVKLRRKRTA